MDNATKKHNDAIDAVRLALASLELEKHRIKYSNEDIELIAEKLMRLIVNDPR